MCWSCKLHFCIGHLSSPLNLQRWQHKPLPPNYNCLAKLIKKMWCQLNWPIFWPTRLEFQIRKKYNSLMEGFPQVTKKLVNIRNASGKGKKFTTINSTPWPSLSKRLTQFKNGKDKSYLVIWVLWFSSILPCVKALLSSDENENDSYY